MSRALASTGNLNTPHPPRRHRRSRLSTARDVRKELARVYAWLASGRLAPELAVKLTYVLGNLLHAIEVADMETKLVELEQLAMAVEDHTHDRLQ